MTLFISIIFTLSCNLFIFKLPTSHGLNQGYHVSTLSQVLTPLERFIFVNFNILPNRIHFSTKYKMYELRGKTDYYKNDLRGKKGKRYKTISRWQFYLNKLSPAHLMKFEYDIASIEKIMQFVRGYINNNNKINNNDNDDNDDNNDNDDNDDDDDNDDNDEDNDEDGATNSKADGAVGADTDSATDKNADGAADHDKNIEEKPELLSKEMYMGEGLVNSLWDLFGGSKDTNNNNDDEKKDDNKEKKEGDKPEDSTSYMGMFGDVLHSDTVGMAKDLLESDVTKEAVKTGISLFIPGGQAFVAAMDAASKYQSVDNTVDKVGDKLHLK